FAQRRRHARGPGRAGDDLAAVLLLQPQRGFECVRIGLVQLEARVGVADPGVAVVDADRRVARDHLLEANGDLHRASRRMSKWASWGVGTSMRPRTRGKSARSGPWALFPTCRACDRVSSCSLPHLPTRPFAYSLPFISLEQQRRVRAAEPERVRQRVVDGG